MTHRGPFQPLLFCDSVIQSHSFMRCPAQFYTDGEKKPRSLLWTFVLELPSIFPSLPTQSSARARAAILAAVVPSPALG